MKYFFIAIGFTVLMKVLEHPVVKGYLGERKVKKILSSLHPLEYKVLSNITIRKENGSTSQIDHVVISIYGIFVIETKNYSGWIYGSEEDQYWTQTFRRAKIKFYNPIRQNLGHIKALQEILSNYPSDIYESIVAFSSNAKLKKLDVTTPVIYFGQLFSAILRFNQQRLFSSEVEDIYNIILRQNITGVKTYFEHADSVNQISNNQRVIRKSNYGFIYKTKKLIKAIAIMVVIFAFISAYNSQKTSSNNHRIYYIPGNQVSDTTNNDTAKPQQNTQSPSPQKNIDNNNIPNQSNSQSQPTNGPNTTNTPTTPKPPAQEAQKTNNIVTKVHKTTFGATKDQVLIDIGEPTKIDSVFNRWYYRESFVGFDGSSKLASLQNKGSEIISIGERDNNALPIKLGSTTEELISLMGTPSIIDSTFKRWYYGDSYVTFDGYYKVNGLFNKGITKISMGTNESSALPMKIGSTHEDLIKLMGTPDIIDSTFKRWYYGESYVSFDGHYKMSDLVNKDSTRITMGEKVNGAEPISIGSTTEDVILLMGTPDVVNGTYKRWHYGESYVIFDRYYKVYDLTNKGTTRLSMGDKDENAAPIKIGSTKEDLIKLMGTPDVVNGTYKRWHYGESYVMFDGYYKIYGLVNKGTTKISMGEKDENAAPLKIGSSSDDVIKLMGTPDRVDGTYKRWHYGESYVEFDSQYKLRNVVNKGEVQIPIGEN